MCMQLIYLPSLFVSNNYMCYTAVHYTYLHLMAFNHSYVHDAFTRTYTYNLAYFENQCGDYSGKCVHYLILEDNNIHIIDCDGTDYIAKCRI